MTLLQERLYRAVADLLEDDIENRAEHLKEFWESCDHSKDEVRRAEQLLRELTAGLRKRAFTKVPLDV